MKFSAKFFPIYKPKKILTKNLPIAQPSATQSCHSAKTNIIMMMRLLLLLGKWPWVEWILRLISYATRHAEQEAWLGRRRIARIYMNNSPEWKFFLPANQNWQSDSFRKGVKREGEREVGWEADQAQIDCLHYANSFLPFTTYKLFSSLVTGCVLYRSR